MSARAAHQADDDARFVREAIRLAIDKMEAGCGGPFGALVVVEGAVAGRGWNRVTSANDPTAHAEIVAIRQACAARRSFRLEGATLYASCEPCPMCLAAAYWARVARVCYACTREDATRAGFADADIYADVSYLPLNIAEGYGLLMVMDPNERPNPRDIVIYEALPNELSRVGGIITTVPQTPLSHVNLRAIQDGVPNAYIEGALEDDLSYYENDEHLLDLNSMASPFQEMREVFDVMPRDGHRSWRSIADRLAGLPLALHAYGTRIEEPGAHE